MRNPLVYEPHFLWEILWFMSSIFSEKSLYPFSVINSSIFPIINPSIFGVKSLYLYIGSLLYCVPIRNSASLSVTLKLYEESKEMLNLKEVLKTCFQLQGSFKTWIEDKPWKNKKKKQTWSDNKGGQRRKRLELKIKCLHYNIYFGGFVRNGWKKNSILFMDWSH